MISPYQHFTEHDMVPNKKQEVTCTGHILSTWGITEIDYYIKRG
jgi:hypothetical protein